MEVVLDSSTLISLAWSGQLGLLQRMPLELKVPEAVRVETVESGLAHGHVDAAAIDTAISAVEEIPTTHYENVDQAVLEAAVKVGVLATNDVALGRRAANNGVRWLRTADLVVLCVRTGRISHTAGTAALEALHNAGRISQKLLNDYRREI
jgi:rRNA-processing protein FCF1